MFTALSFGELDEHTANALSRFVQSQENFRDFFSWLIVKTQRSRLAR